MRGQTRRWWAYFYLSSTVLLRLWTASDSIPTALLEGGPTVPTSGANLEQLSVGCEATALIAPNAAHPFGRPLAQPDVFVNA